MFVETNPAAIKWLLAERGLLGSAFVRPPLIPLTEAGRVRARQLLAERRGPRSRTEPVMSPADMPTHLPHCIGGEAVDSVSGAAFDVLDPVSNKPYATASAGGAADVDRAVAAARRAFTDGPWPALPDRARARILFAVADAIEAREGRLAELRVVRHRPAHHPGPRPGAAGGGELPLLRRPHRGPRRGRLPVGGDQLNYVVRKPVGVAGLITPWNTPFMLESWKLAPALASGCTLVLKPAEWTPLSAGAVAGDHRTRPACRPGCSTSSTASARRPAPALVDAPGRAADLLHRLDRHRPNIIRSAAEHLKGLSMELGGKSPVVVFADADLDAALDSVVFGVFSLNGERCTAGSRVLVERSVYEEFARRYAERAAAIVVGDPPDPATEVGALVHPEHYERVLGYVEIGKAEGRLVAGGSRPEHLPEGNYLPADRVRRRRPGRPNLPGGDLRPGGGRRPFDDRGRGRRAGQRDALRAGRATSGRLDLKRGHRIAHARIESGMVWINSHNVRDLRTPFGGVKDSGVGREGGAPQHRLLHRVERSSTSPSARCTPPDSERPRDRLPDVIRSAYAELVVTDLAASRWFWVDMLGLVVQPRTPTRSTCAAPRSSPHH